MKKFVLLPLALALLAGCENTDKDVTTDGEAITQEASTAFEAPEQRFSYVMGYSSGQQLKDMNVQIDDDAFRAGIKDALSNAESQLSEEQIKATLTDFEAKMRADREEAHRIQIEANVKEGQEFLAANATKEGVVTLESGLQYKVLTEGSGPMPTTEDTVEVNYIGKLLDGTVFNDSNEMGGPVSFGVTGVIPGWTEALLLMNEGSKWEIYVPSDLAYGPGGTGRGGPIGPSQTLIFEIELLKASVKAE